MNIKKRKKTAQIYENILVRNILLKKIILNKL